MGKHDSKPDGYLRFSAIFAAVLVIIVGMVVAGLCVWNVDLSRRLVAEQFVTTCVSRVALRDPALDASSDVRRGVAKFYFRSHNGEVLT